MDSVKSQIKPNKACFEIFGYDFLVDSDFESWLIEVNTNPCLEESSPLLSQLVPRMINDSLRLTIDKIFEPKHGQKNYDNEKINFFKVPGYDDN